MAGGGSGGAGATGASGATGGVDGSGGVGGVGGVGLTGATGGVPGTGGTATGTGGAGTGTGGAATGGTGTGGRMGTGGSATGGGGTGGIATGGSGTGGAATGGRGTGGAATGGMGTGGAATGGAGPQILSIDFVGGKTVAAGGGGGTELVPYIAMAATEIAGLKRAANWNGAVGPMGTATALMLMDGTATTASVTWRSPLTAANPGIWQNAYLDAPGDVRMMNGYLDPTATASPATVTVTGLPASFGAAGYDVYVYATGDIPNAAVRTYKYEIGNTMVMVTQTGPNPAAFPGYVVAPAAGTNTVIFHNVTGTSFTLTATPANAAQRGPVNGLQIVSPTGM